MSLAVTRIDLSRIVVTTADHVIFQELENEMVLLDLQTGGYYGLNEVGTRIWRELQEGRSPEDIVAALVRDYEIADEQVEQDMRSFLASLEGQGLISVDELDG